MPTIPERAFDYTIATLLYPARVPPRILTRIAGTVVVGLLIGIGLLTFPPLKNLIFCHFSMFREARTEADNVKNWCDFISVVSQIGIILAIGGVVFTDGIASWFRQRAQVVQTKFQEITEALHANPNTQLTARQKSLLDDQKKIDDIRRGVKFRNLPSKIRAASHVVDHMYITLTPEIPQTMSFVMRHFIGFPFFPINRLPVFRDNKLMILMTMRYGLAFPGGLYGSFAFLFFVCLVGSLALKTYFDYPPPCT